MVIESFGTANYKRRRGSAIGPIGPVRSSSGLRADAACTRAPISLDITGVTPVQQLRSLILAAALFFHSRVASSSDSRLLYETPRRQLFEKVSELYGFRFFLYFIFVWDRSFSAFSSTTSLLKRSSWEVILEACTYFVHRDSTFPTRNHFQQEVLIL